MTRPLGLESGVVRVVDYDPSWPGLFVAEAADIADAIAHRGLPPLLLEHIGSTAIPGLRAKPILDVLAGHRDDVPATDYVEAMSAVGYIYRGDRGLPGREFFRRGDPRSHHVHLTAVGGHYWRDYLAFRDILRANTALAAEYAALKSELAARHPRDRERYIEGKTAFVQRILAISADRRSAASPARAG
jgi:GrpB-like predicted nucleotidyltransferase (UPF0157 family)